MVRISRTMDTGSQHPLTDGYHESVQQRRFWLREHTFGEVNVGDCYCLSLAAVGDQKHAELAVLR